MPEDSKKTFLMNAILLITFVTVPSSAPLNVSGRAINSTTVIISWELPAQEGRNGNITGYFLLIREVATNITSTHSSTGARIELVVASLHPYYEYECQIAAETAVGRGPFGDTIVIRTLPDGKWQSTSIF